MSHLTEDDLVLLYYDEHDDTAAAEAHLAGCDACRRAFESLRSDLAGLSLDVPPTSPGYGVRVWEKVEPRLAAPLPLLRRPVVRRMAGFLAVAAALVVAFLLGRLSPRSGGEETVAETRERILLAAVARHLDRSQRVLVELSHADDADLGELPARAERLVAENRLYRQSAEQAGEAGLASLLDDLGRVLVEVAHAPDPMTRDEVRALNARVERKELLFKVRVVGARLTRTETKRPAMRGSSL